MTASEDLCPACTSGDHAGHRLALPSGSCAHCYCPEPYPLQVDDFPASYRARLIQAYPVIAGMGPEQFYAATLRERDAAFARILASRNLRLTHELYLRDKVKRP